MNLITQKFHAHRRLFTGVFIIGIFMGSILLRYAFLTGSNSENFQKSGDSNPSSNYLMLEQDLEIISKIGSDATDIDLLDKINPMLLSFSGFLENRGQISSPNLPNLGNGG